MCFKIKYYITENWRHILPLENPKVHWAQRSQSMAFCIRLSEGCLSKVQSSFVNCIPLSLPTYHIQEKQKGSFDRRETFILCWWFIKISINIWVEIYSAAKSCQQMFTIDNEKKSNMRSGFVHCRMESIEKSGYR